MFRNIAVQGITLLAYALGNYIVAVVDKMGASFTLFGIERTLYGTAICLALNGFIQILLGLCMPLLVGLINKYKVKDRKVLEVESELLGAQIQNEIANVQNSEQNMSKESKQEEKNDENAQNIQQ